MDSDPQGDAPASDVLDAQALSKLGQLDPGGKGALVQRVLTTYAGSLARLKQQIVDGHVASDLAALRLGAHTLKSSSASVGALRLSTLCAAVEQMLREERSPELPAMVGQLLAEIDRVDQAVRRRIQQPPPAR
jgi:HPt (histidine-containing phosphotransfer) domain-containing protein